MTIPIEIHPFSPFLPENAKILFLGSFPPPKKRWSMEFYYPNYTNDFWHMIGLIWFHDKDSFCSAGEKKFKIDEIINFCKEKGIALYDTAYKIRRLQDNASDKYLEIIEPADICTLAKKIPECRMIVTTGQKATETAGIIFNCKPPEIGHTVEIYLNSRKMEFIRMPSTSRAYPLALENKASQYKRLFEKAGLL